MTHTLIMDIITALFAIGFMLSWFLWFGHLLAYPVKNSAEKMMSFAFFTISIMASFLFAMWLYIINR